MRRIAMPTNQLLSIVIPVYNEEELLRDAVVGLVNRVRPDFEFELIITENGSTDATKAIAEELSREMEEVTCILSNQPNYGAALRRGIEMAVGDYVACDEIDLCDDDFYRRAMTAIENTKADMVVGSKAMKGANDQRPVFRRFATKVINGMLRLAVDFQGTDTHGLKLFHRKSVLPIVGLCVVDRDLFASELVIRSHREGLHVIEIPVEVEEKRRPAISLARRVPQVLKGMATLTYHIRWGDKR